MITARKQAWTKERRHRQLPSPNFSNPIITIKFFLNFYPGVILKVFSTSHTFLPTPKQNPPLHIVYPLQKLYIFNFFSVIFHEIVLPQLTKSCTGFNQSIDFIYSSQTQNKWVKKHSNFLFSPTTLIFPKERYDDINRNHKLVLIRNVNQQRNYMQISR